MKARKKGIPVLSDKRLLKISTLNFGEVHLFNCLLNHPGLNRVGCLEGKLIWDLNLPSLPLFHKTSSQVKNFHEISLNGLARKQLIVFDKETDLIYLTIYLNQFPLKNIKEGRKAERLFNEIPQKASFYSLLAFDLLQMLHLEESFRKQLINYLNNFLQSGVTTSC